MQGELGHDAGAGAYEAEVRERLGGEPRFDIVLLGVGPDGHTASLFPGTAAVDERERTVIANWMPQQNERRLTLTLPVLNASRWAVFLVTGREKSEVVAAVAERKAGSRDLPASLVRPTAGSLIWIVDEAAAAEL
jgi:6-phosphogluconolactonase